MDLFGGSPAKKLNKVIEEGNRNFENRLNVHNALIDVNLEKIENLIIITRELDEKVKKLETMCAQISSKADAFQKENDRYIIDEIRSQILNISKDTMDRISVLKQRERELTRIVDNIKTIINYM